MAQTTTAGPTSTTFTGIANDWTNPNNSQVDDASNATGASTLNILGTDPLVAATFNLLSEEGGSVLTGIKIPTTASIVGVRFSYDVITAGGAPHILTLASSPGASTDPFAGTSQVVRTIGYGTLSSGSSVAGGNTWGSNDLSTDAGALTARASLANATLSATVTGGVGSVTTNATYGIDYFRVTVEWVIRVTAPGGAKATAKNGGSLSALITEAGGAKAGAKTGGSPQAQVSQNATGAKTSAKAGGSPHPLITQGGGAKASSTAGGSPHPFVTPTGGGKTGAKAGAGVTTVVSFAISGIARDGDNDNPITTGVRVDVYRTSDHEHMGRDTTDGAGEYAVAIPFTGNEGEVFWSRFYQAGTPNRFATTDEDLELIEAVVQSA